MSCESLIIVLSGKRKSGKDHVAEILKNKIKDYRCSILRLSHPIKSQYAKEHGLNLEKLLDSSSYKEVYRSDMIRWGEDKRNKDPSIFIRAATSGPGSEKPVWLISDARRISDIECLMEMFPGKIVTVRVEADEEVRKRRGWKFIPGVDDAMSECGLDVFKKFDHIVINNGSEEELESSLDDLLLKIAPLSDWNSC